MASKILFYRLKYKFLIINYIYMLRWQVGSDYQRLAYITNDY